MYTSYSRVIFLPPRNRASSIQINRETGNDQALDCGIKDPFPGRNNHSIHAYKFRSPFNAQNSDDTQGLDDLEDIPSRGRDVQCFIVRVEHQSPTLCRLRLAIVDERGTVRVNLTTQRNE